MLGKIISTNSKARPNHVFPPHFYLSPSQSHNEIADQRQRQIQLCCLWNPSMKLEVKLSIQGLETRIMGTWGPGDVPSPFQSQYYPCWVFKTTPGVEAQTSSMQMISYSLFSILTLGNVLTIFLASYHKAICILGCAVICKAIVTMLPGTTEDGRTSHPKWQVKDSSRTGSLIHYLLPFQCWNAKKLPDLPLNSSSVLPPLDKLTERAGFWYFLFFIKSIFAL